MPKRLIIILLMLLLIAPVAAQEEEPPPLTPEQVQQVLEVQGAYERLQFQSSYKVSGSVVGAQELTVEGGAAYFNNIVLDFTWDFTVIPRRNTLDNVQGVTDLIFSLEESEGAQRVEATFESVILDGISYTNVRNGVPGVELNTWMQDPPINADAPIPPDKSATETFLFYYLVNEDRVQDITRLPDTTSVNGQTLKVFEVMLSVPALREANVMTVTEVGDVSANLSASLGGLGDITQQATYKMTVSIGVDDNLPHEVSYSYLNTLTAEQRDGFAQQDIQGTLIFSDFGADATITNPLEGDASAIDVELVTYVQDAYTNLRNTRGYRISGSASGSQTQRVPDQSYEGTFDLSSTYTGAVIPQSDSLDRVQLNSDVAATLTENGQLVQDLAVNYDFILAEDQSWINLRSGNAGGPTDIWQGPNPTSTEPIPTDRVYSEAFLFYYLLEPGTVASITELPEQEIDGETVRVFEVGMKIGVLRTQDVISPTGIGQGTDNNLSANFGDRGGVSADTIYTMTIYVSTRNQLPRRADFTFDNVITTGTDANGEQNISGTVDFFDFNDNTISIEPPI